MDKKTLLLGFVALVATALIGFLLGQSSSSPSTQDVAYNQTVENNERNLSPVSFDVEDEDFLTQLRIRTEFGEELVWSPSYSGSNEVEICLDSFCRKVFLEGEINLIAEDNDEGDRGDTLSARVRVEGGSMSPKTGDPEDLDRLGKIAYNITQNGEDYGSGTISYEALTEGAVWELPGVTPSEDGAEIEFCVDPVGSAYGPLEETNESDNCARIDL